MICYFSAGQAEYLAMYKSFFENYDGVDLIHGLRDRRSISSIVITTNQVATHLEIFKQSEPTGATTSAELYSSDKGIIKSVDVRHFDSSIGYPICEPTTVHEDNTGTVRAVTSDCLTLTYRHDDVKIHRIL
eukprot:7280587-Ditylum_brightwellii.AAC.1